MSVVRSGKPRGVAWATVVMVCSMACLCGCDDNRHTVTQVNYAPPRGGYLSSLRVERDSGNGDLWFVMECRRSTVEVKVSNGSGPGKIELLSGTTTPVILIALDGRILGGGNYQTRTTWGVGSQSKPPYRTVGEAARDDMFMVFYHGMNK